MENEINDRNQEIKTKLELLLSRIDEKHRKTLDNLDQIFNGFEEDNTDNNTEQK